MKTPTLKVTGSNPAGHTTSEALKIKASDFLYLPFVLVLQSGFRWFSMVFDGKTGVKMGVRKKHKKRTWQISLPGLFSVHADAVKSVQFVSFYFLINRSF